MIFKNILIVFYLFLTTFLSIAQEEILPTEVSYNLYAITGLDGGNVAFLVTRKGIVVVNAGSTPSEGQKVVSVIKSISNRPIKYLILTDFHGDNINGISAFPSDITIIAHKNLLRNNSRFNEKYLKYYVNEIIPEHLVNLKLQMGAIKNKESEEYITLKNDYETNQKYYEDIKNIRFRNPDITFEDYYRFKIDDERIMLEYPGPGHTTDNILVKFSNHNVIHTGDLVFSGCFPYLLTEHGTDVYNWIKILNDLYKENIKIVIPGHGEIDNKIAIKNQADYFITLSRKVEYLKNVGLDLDDIKGRIFIDQFELEGNEDQFPVNIEVIYSELTIKGTDWWEF